MKKLLLLLLLPLILPAADRKWLTSVGTLAASATMDIASSVGQYEANPLFRGRDGKFNLRRGVLVKAGLCTGFLLIGKKNKKVGFVVNITASGLWAGVAIRNWRVR